MHVKRNEATINKAFQGLIHNKHQHLISGMKSLLENAVLFALQLHHEQNLPGHLETGDSYGWALGYNGQCLAVKVTVGEIYMENGAGVEETLQQLASHYSKGQSYVGIVMAGMEPSHFYKVEYEEDILSSTVQMSVVEFDKYFKKI